MPRTTPRSPPTTSWAPCWARPTGWPFPCWPRQGWSPPHSPTGWPTGSTPSPRPTAERRHAVAPEPGPVGVRRQPARATWATSTSRSSISSWPCRISSGSSATSCSRALRQVRGSHRVTSQNPEEQYQALEKYGRDLTELARRGKLDPVIGRDEEIRRIIQVLSRRTKNNPVLIGEPGVGKTAIVEGLANRIVEGRCPRGPARQARGGPRPVRHGGRCQVPGGVRGAVEGRAQGDHRLRGRDHHLHRRAPHHRGRGRGRRGHGRRQHDQAHAGAR